MQYCSIGINSYNACFCVTIYNKTKVIFSVPSLTILHILLPRMNQNSYKYNHFKTSDLGLDQLKDRLSWTELGLPVYLPRPHVSMLRKARAPLRRVFQKSNEESQPELS